MNNKWPKYRIYGEPDDCRVQVAYGLKGPFWNRKPRWLSPLGIGSFKSVAEAEEYCALHKRRFTETDTIKTIE